MVNIKVDDSFRIVSDEYSYCLQKFKCKTKKNIDVWESLCYHNDIGGCLESYLEIKIKHKDISTIKQFILEHKKLNGYIRKIMNREMAA